jgi:cytochrome c2
MPSRFAWVAMAAVGLLTGCASESKTNAAVMTGGDPNRGATQISRYGCGSCHSIPGISGAQGRVGPSLAGLGSRTYVAGSLGNQPANLVHWIQDPHSVNEKTVMPNLGVSAHDATDIAAYLYSLR